MIHRTRLFICLACLIAPAVSGLQALADPPAGDQPSKRRAVTVRRPVDPLLEAVDEAIDVSSRRYLVSNVHTPWQILHGALAHRRDYRIKDPDGKVINAIEWISSGPRFRGEPWFEKTRFGGRAHPYSGRYAFEGHVNQTLAYLSLSDLPLEHEFKTEDGSTITVGDMVNHAKMEVNAGEEISWTLWALSKYLEPNAQWENKYGESWSIERLVQMQIRAPMERAACGGTHALFALTMARNAYLEKTKGPLRGVWLEADQHIRRYVETARESQNPDGTFSTSFFQGRGQTQEFEKRLHSSGHTLEFLVVALPQERLNENWVRHGVWTIAQDLIRNRRQTAEPGALYHAVDALVLYRDRMTRKAEIVPAKQEGGETVSGTEPPETANAPKLAAE